MLLNGVNRWRTRASSTGSPVQFTGEFNNAPYATQISATRRAKKLSHYISHGSYLLLTLHLQNAWTNFHDFLAYFSQRLFIMLRCQCPSVLKMWAFESSGLTWFCIWQPELLILLLGSTTIVINLCWIVSCNRTLGESIGHTGNMHTRFGGLLLLTYVLEICLHTHKHVYYNRITNISLRLHTSWLAARNALVGRGKWN